MLVVSGVSFGSDAGVPVRQLRTSWISRSTTIGHLCHLLVPTILPLVLILTVLLLPKAELALSPPQRAAERVRDAVAEVLFVVGVNDLAGGGRG